MFAALEAGAGLDVVLALQSAGNTLLDAIATLFAVLGSDTGYLVLLPLIFWVIDRKLGYRLLFVLTAGLALLIGGKELFMRPRPFVFAPDEVRAVVEASGFGFPSAHVGLSTAVWGFVALWYRKWWGYALLAAYIIIMAWARMYAGVHYPQDVVGGLIIGLVVMFSARNEVASLAPRWNALPRLARAAILVVVGLVVAFLLRGDDDGLSTAGIIIGGGLAVTLAPVAFATGGSVRQRGLRFLLGLVLTAVVFVGLDFAFEALSPAAFWRVLRYALVSAVILGVWPVLMVRFGLAALESAA